MIKLLNTLIFITFLFFTYSCSTKSNKETTNSPPSLKDTAVKNSYAKVNDTITEETPVIKYLDSVIIDAYGKRGVVFRSPNTEEQLFHVRILSEEASLIYIFMGAVIPKDSTDTSHFTRIYEYTEKEGIHVIDSMKIAAFNHYWVHNGNGVYFEQMLLRNSDNLLFKEKTLLYYKENRSEENKYSNPGKKYFSYIINSKKTPTEISEYDFYKDNPRRQTSTINHVLLSPERNFCLTSDVYNIRFYNHLKRDSILILQKQNNEAISKYFNSESVKSSLSLFDYFPTQSIDEICDEEALFGHMVWHPMHDTLFFDNSGYCYACIWMFDYKSREAKKLVPEHEAIHPFFFIKENQEFLAYVQTNEIRVYELNSYNEEFENINFRSPENQDDSNRNRSLLNRYKNILEDIDKNGILRANIEKVIIYNRDPESKTSIYSERDSKSTEVTTLNQDIIAGILEEDSVSDENGYKWYKIINPNGLTFGWVYGINCYKFEFCDTNIVHPSSEESSPAIYFGTTWSNYEDPPNWNDMPVNDNSSLEFIINMSTEKLIIIYETLGSDCGEHTLEIKDHGTFKDNHLYLNCTENYSGQDGGSSTKCKYDINLLTGEIEKNCEEPTEYQ